MTERQALKSRIVGEGDVSPKQLLANPLNWRKHPKAQADALEGMLRSVGWVQRVIVNRTTGHVVDGHLRVELALRRGEPSVPVLYVELTEAEERIVLAAIDPIGGLAETDQGLLDQLLDGLASGDDDLDAFLDSLRSDGQTEPDEGLTDPDDAPDVRADPVTKPGDVWVMDKHRLMCGDSTSIAQAERLMGGGMADLVFTDPPYNVAYEGRGEKNKMGTIKNDNMSDESFEQFCRDFFSAYHAVMKPLACIYVCHPDSQSKPKLAFEKTFAEMFKKSSTLIWMKQSAGMGWQDYRAQHEPILYGWKEGVSGKHFYCGDRAKTTVWQIGRDAQMSYVHPTQKPVALPEEAINNSSKVQDVVLDLFGGSGSTLIACEKTGRVARLMELDPKYCDVIVRRWQAFTGKPATLESDGRTFADVEAEAVAA